MCCKAGPASCCSAGNNCPSAPGANNYYGTGKGPACCSSKAEADYENMDTTTSRTAKYTGVVTDACSNWGTWSKATQDKNMAQEALNCQVMMDEYMMLGTSLSWLSRYSFLRVFSFMHGTVMRLFLELYFSYIFISLKDRVGYAGTEMHGDDAPTPAF